MNKKIIQAPGKYSLTVEQALPMLDTFREDRKKRIHTFTKQFGCMMGCNVDYIDIVKRMRESESIMLSVYIEKNNAGHGVAFFDKKTDGYMLLATDDDALSDFFKERGI